MFRPKAAYAHLAAHPASGRWLPWRRPLLVALILGCTISLITSRSLTLRLAASGTVTWSFVPLLEIGSLAAIWRHRPRLISRSRAVDLFFTGHGPWSFWLIGFGAFWSSVSQSDFSTATEYFWLGSVPVMLLWSGYIDFCFLQGVLGRSRTRAIRDLLLQRAICWGAGILIFGYGSLWADIVERLP